MLAPWLRVTVLFSMGGLFAGCASITEGTTQDILIGTTPVSGASCYLRNDKGAWTIKSTPATVTINKDRAALKVMCQHPQAGDGTVMGKSSIGPMYFGNAILGGAIGMTVDTQSGAAYHYPESVTIALTGLDPDAPAAAGEGQQSPKERDAVAAAPAAEPGPVSSTGDSAVEIAFWNSVKDSNDAELYEAYLQRYPKGNFAVIARIKVKQLASGRRGGGAREATVQKSEPASDAADTSRRFGDTVQFACPKPGTTIELSDGGTLVFAKTQGVLCAYATGAGGELATVSLLGSFDREAPKLVKLWPLTVGKSIEFSYVAGPNASRQAKLTITRHELVTVKAGTFDAFVIEARIWSPGRSFIGAYGETVTYWFAPAVGYPVKITHQLDNGPYATGPDNEAVKVVISSVAGAGPSF